MLHDYIFSGDDIKPRDIQARIFGVLRCHGLSPRDVEQVCGVGATELDSIASQPALAAIETACRVLDLIAQHAPQLDELRSGRQVMIGERRLELYTRLEEFRARMSLSWEQANAFIKWVMQRYARQLQSFEPASFEDGIPETMGEIRDLYQDWNRRHAK